jgi:hypothetical protein
MAEAQAVKICATCNKDVSKSPRSKDRNGVYYCIPCTESTEAAVARKQQAAVRVPAARQATPPPPIEETFDLAPVQAAAPPPTRPCPSCQNIILADVAECPYCGHDENRKTKGKAEKGRSEVKCSKCGYVLKGLRSFRCPECGTVNAPASKADLLKEDSRQIAKWAYLRPVIMFALGMLGIIVFNVVSGHTEKLPFYFIKYLVGVPVGLLVYFICCLVWVGFDMPLHLIALRIAGIYAVVDLVALFLELLPSARISVFFIGPWSLYALIYVFLMKSELDLELSDAAIISALTGFAKIVTWLVIAAAVASALGIPWP